MRNLAPLYSTMKKLSIALKDYPFAMLDVLDQKVEECMEHTDSSEEEYSTFISELSRFHGGMGTLNDIPLGGEERKLSNAFYEEVEKLKNAAHY